MVTFGQNGEQRLKRIETAGEHASGGRRAVTGTPTAVARYGITRAGGWARRWISRCRAVRYRRRAGQAMTLRPSPGSPVPQAPLALAAPRPDPRP
jgi:hypothetical protein